LHNGKSRLKYCQPAPLTHTLEGIIKSYNNNKTTAKRGSEREKDREMSGGLGLGGEAGLG